jgi:hypothetical protein
MKLLKVGYVNPCMPSTNGTPSRSGKNMDSFGICVTADAVDVISIEHISPMIRDFVFFMFILIIIIF